MAVFAVIGEDDVSSERLEQTVRAAFPEKCYRFSSRAYFVASKTMTSVQVSDALGVKKGGFTGVAIVQITSSYWGVANSTLWPWLKTAIEEDGG